MIPEAYRLQRAFLSQSTRGLSARASARAGDWPSRHDRQDGLLLRDRLDRGLAAPHCKMFQSILSAVPWRVVARRVWYGLAGCQARLPAIFATKRRLAALARPSNATPPAADRGAGPC